MGYLEKATARYRRLRRIQRDADQSIQGVTGILGSAQRHALLATIGMAFFIGFLIGRKESTPLLFSSISYKLSETIGLSADLPMDHWIGQLTKERILLEDRLMASEYGNIFYAQLFEPTQLSMFRTTDESKEHLKRRLKIKFLSKLVHPLHPSNFVWATAGDAIAAGHGNMFNQSYTAMLEDTVGAAFASVGINFVARNYGISFYDSGPELALCMEAIYGKDVDLLSWDFLLHDNNPQRMRLWGQRAMGHPKKPALLFFIDGDGERQPYLQELNDQGLSVFAYDTGEAENVIQANVPETNVADPNEQLPPALEYLVCTEGSLEGILPCLDGVRFDLCEHAVAQQCLAQKYNTLPDCALNQHSHHPGWKLHLLRGRLLGHYLLQLLEESLMEIDRVGGGRAPSTWHKTLLDQLNRQESAYLHRLEKSKPNPAKDDSYTVDGVANSASIIRELGTPNLFRAPSVCHTALLPAESRYKGFVTESDQVGDWRDGSYDIGTNKIKAFQQDVDSSHGPMKAWQSPLLVYEMGDRHRCASPKIDHKDYFLVRNTEKDWLHMYVPTETELQVYHQHSGKPPLQGILIVCVSHCPNEMCPPEHVYLNNERKDTWVEIQVDGQPIKSVLPLDGTCSILETKHGIRWGSQTNYRISFKVVTKKQGFNYLFKISSVIIL